MNCINCGATAKRLIRKEGTVWRCPKCNKQFLGEVYPFIVILKVKDGEWDQAHHIIQDIINKDSTFMATFHPRNLLISIFVTSQDIGHQKGCWFKHRAHGDPFEYYAVKKNNKYRGKSDAAQN